MSGSRFGHVIGVTVIGVTVIGVLVGAVSACGGAAVPTGPGSDVAAPTSPAAPRSSRTSTATGPARAPTDPGVPSRRITPGTLLDADEFASLGFRPIHPQGGPKPADQAAWCTGDGGGGACAPKALTGATSRSYTAYFSLSGGDGGWGIAQTVGDAPGGKVHHAYQELIDEQRDAGSDDEPAGHWYMGPAQTVDDQEEIEAAWFWTYDGDHRRTGGTIVARNGDYVSLVTVMGVPTGVGDPAMTAATRAVVAGLGR